MQLLDKVRLEELLWRTDFEFTFFVIAVHDYDVKTLRLGLFDIVIGVGNLRLELAVGMQAEMFLSHFEDFWVDLDCDYLLKATSKLVSNKHGQYARAGAQHEHIELLRIFGLLHEMISDQ